MKPRGREIGDGGWPARSVLECGSPLPLLKGDEPPVAVQSARGLAQSKTWRSFVAALAFLATAIIAHAQSYSIDWFTIDGGGGSSTGGVYSVSGTIGQPDADAMSGGPFSIVGGLWSILSAVQTLGAPLLSIRQDTNRVVTIEWPRPAEGWVLDQTSAFGTNAAATVWSQVPFPYVTNATQISITTNAPSGHWFFRLRKP